MWWAVSKMAPNILSFLVFTHFEQVEYGISDGYHFQDKL